MGASPEHFTRPLPGGSDRTNIIRWTVGPSYTTKSKYCRFFACLFAKQKNASKNSQKVTSSRSQKSTMASPPDAQRLALFRSVPARVASGGCGAWSVGRRRPHGADGALTSAGSRPPVALGWQTPQELTSLKWCLLNTGYRRGGDPHNRAQRNRPSCPPPRRLHRSPPPALPPQLATACPF